MGIRTKHASQIRTTDKTVQNRRSLRSQLSRSGRMVASSNLQSEVPSKLFLGGMCLFCAPIYRLSLGGSISKVESGLMSFACPAGGALLIGAWLAMAWFD